MPKHKPKRSKPTLDMTPMVDLAFLLVTFFMLTASFRATEAKEVTIPSSVAEFPVPDKNLITLTVDDSGNVFFDISTQIINDDYQVRERLLQKMGEDYSVNFTQDELTTYRLMSSTGVPMSKMKSFLRMNQAERKKFVQEGVPTDSVGDSPSELHYWLQNARYSNGAAIITLKADRNTAYPHVKKVIDIMQAQPVPINNFSLITASEANPNEN